MYVCAKPRALVEDQIPVSKVEHDGLESVSGPRYLAPENLNRVIGYDGDIPYGYIGEFDPARELVFRIFCDPNEHLPTVIGIATSDGDNLLRDDDVHSFIF